jgi:hypothetical protein
MKAASLSELKTALQLITPKEVVDVCLRMVRARKENKELLSYLLFEANDEAGYIKDVKLEIEEQFKKVSRRSLYTSKIEVRKILKYTYQQVKYSGQKRTEIELLIHFCKELKTSGISLHNHPVLLNIFLRQVQKIKKILSTLHEDLQFDYGEELRGL